MNPGCNFYKVKLDQHGAPILGTMMMFETPQIINGCNEALVPATQMSYTGQLFPPSGLRYYYKVDSNCNIVPNSMFSKKTPEKNWSSGPNKILEFVIYSCSTY
jgi:hypothetical protein